MIKNLLFSSNGKTICVLMALMLSSVCFAQTTITSGTTVNASTIAENSNVTIEAGGTLNMDANKTFTNITTVNNGTSTISGAAELKVANTITVGGGNTLSVAPAITTINLVTAVLNNQTVSIIGTGSISAGTININGVNNNPAGLTLGASLAIEAGAINGGSGNANTTYNFTANGSLKISGNVETGNTGIESFTCGAGSAVEYNGGVAQTVYATTYNNLTLSGVGAKTLAGSTSLTGNFLLEANSSLTLGANNLAINVSGDRSATINGTLTINGTGRLTKSLTGTKTLAMGAAGYIVLSGANTALPGFDVYDFDAASRVNYGSAGAQTIENSAIYGSLSTSGSGTKTLETAGGSMTFQGGITIGTGTILDGSSKQVNVAGNWENNGTFTAGTGGSIAFNGAAAQTLGGTQPSTFGNITFNNANGVGLNQPITATGVVAFSNGIITPSAPTNLLIFTATATSGASSDLSFVNGPVRKQFANTAGEQFVFPLGAAGTGNEPLTISDITAGGVAYDFTAEYKRGSATSLGTAYSTPIKNVSACDYWSLTKNDGKATGISVTLSWDANSPCNGNDYITNPATLTVAHLNGSTWEQAGPTGATSFPTASSVKRTNVDAFSPFSLGNTVIGDNPLPVVFANVKAYEKNIGVQIEWSNLTEKDVVGYTVERSVNGKDFSSIAELAATSNQNDKADYQSFDPAPVSGVSYYRIKALETTGKIVYSKILSISLGKSVTGLKLYPNPVMGNQATISLSNLKLGQYNLQIANTSGVNVYTRVIRTQSSNLTQILDLPSTIKPGVYTIVITGESYKESKVFIVQ